MTDQGIVKLNHSESKEYAAHKWASESPAVQSQRDAEQYQSRLATPLLDTFINSTLSRMPLQDSRATETEPNSSTV